jgi:hypothetical protein
VLELCLGKEKAGASNVFLIFFNNFINRKYLLAKIHWAGQLERQKMPQPGKEQCLPTAVHRG